MRNKFVLFLLSFFSLWAIAPTAFAAVWTIAIDPGHGGKDPGAISRNLNIQEKNVTLSIARELKALLDRDPRFRAVMTRIGDYYVSAPERSEIARKYKANYLVSIHADSSVSNTLRGASVWVLSNRRANDEMGQWLEDNEKRSELLGGAGSVLSSHKDRYLDQTVLDLQFGHSQRVGYELGSIVLRHFAGVASLSRSVPQHASLGVLRSPDIPSILVETGFLSNDDEEAKLATATYRKKIARIIYDGLVEYRNKNYKDEKIKVPATNDIEEKTSEKNTALDSKKSAQEEKSENKNAVKDSGLRHKVKTGENLSTLAQKYQVNAQDVLTLNKLKRKELWIGETLKIPDNGKNSQTDKAEKTPKSEKTKTDKEDKKTVEKNSKEKNNKENKNEKSAVKKSEKSTALDSKNSAKNDKEKATPKFHIVGKDQTLYSIAREYNIPVNKLLKLNPKLKDGKVLTGQKVKLQE